MGDTSSYRFPAWAWATRTNKFDAKREEKIDRQNHAPLARLSRRPGFYIHGDGSDPKLPTSTGQIEPKVDSTNCTTIA
jgi:hypothetical protein